MIDIPNTPSAAEIAVAIERGRAERANAIAAFFAAFKPKLSDATPVIVPARAAAC